MNGHCGCDDDAGAGAAAAEGRATPLAIENRAGLSALACRVGTHATFLATMQARLSSYRLDDDDDGAAPPLAALTTREPDDPAIALLDAWASVADVLTFYQERIANEGYLRTAVEDRSVQALAAMVGYVPRPGLAASVFLAFGVDDPGGGADVVIPASSPVQSVPVEGLLPQTFETTERLVARPVWSRLRPRLQRPQRPALESTELYLEGIATPLQPNDPLLLVVAGEPLDPPLRVARVEPQYASNRTRVVLQTPLSPRRVAAAAAAADGSATAAASGPGAGAASAAAGPTGPAAAPGSASGAPRSAAPAAASAAPGSASAAPAAASGAPASAAPEAASAVPAAAAPGEPAAPEAASAAPGAAAPAEPVVPEAASAAPAAAAAAEPAAPEAASAAPGAAAPAAPAEPAAPADPAAPTTPLANASMLAALARSAIPPSPRRAGRLPAPASAAVFAVDSETAAQVATAFAPALKRVLGGALARSPLDAGAAQVEVHAFRVRATPFGHNAPLQAVPAPDGGAPTLREWTLATAVADHVPEPFHIDAEFGAAARDAEGAPLAMRVSVKIGDHPARAGQTDASGSDFKIVDREADEETVVSIAEGVVFTMKRRGITLQLVPGARNAFTASASGCDPVRLEMVPAGDAERGRGTMRLAGRTRGAPGTTTPTEAAETVWLDAVRDGIVPGGWLLLQRADEPAPVIARVQASTTGARAAYGMSGATTRVALDVPWLGPGRGPGRRDADIVDESFRDVIRGSVIHARSEALALAQAPETADVAGSTIELDGVYLGLDSGRWLIVEGERTDVDGVPGVPGAEVVRLANASHGAAAAAPGETAHTLLTLAAPLVHRYRRDSVTIHANVAHASHGQTQRELLGSGDGTRPLQAFATKQGPLTFVPAVGTSGAASTLEVRVNDIRWHEVDRLDDAGPTDRRYTTRRNDDGSTAIVFGDGRHGARLPTGIDNVRAVYRRGLGVAGNVAAGQLSTLAARPLGVGSVTNPLAASGGADPETAASARRNAPLALLALDRLVSVADHADFARVHAGVGKAGAVRLATAGQPVVCVTIAGTDETPIEPASALCVDLAASMRANGDPLRALRVLPAEPVLLVIEARVRLLADHAWETVEAALRAALLAGFGYAARDLGQDVASSQVVAALQRVPGVDGVDLDRFGSVGQATAAADLERLAAPAAPRGRVVARVRAAPARVSPVGAPLAAQIVFVTARVPGLVRLSEAAT